MEKQRVTFEQIVHANKFIDTTDIKGKSYAQVNQRIKAFRMLYPEGRIKTEIVSENDGKIIMKATIFDESGTELSNAFSYEKEAGQTSTGLLTLRTVKLRQLVGRLASVALGST